MKETIAAQRMGVPVFRGRGKAACDGASALIVTLWVITLLSVMIGSFAFDAHVEARIISYRRKLTKAEYLAKSMVDISEMLLEKSRKLRMNPKILTERDEAAEQKDRWLRYARALAVGMAVRGLEEKLGEGVITMDIVPEPARRNINALGQTDEERRANLERILEVAGVPEELWSELIDSFLDWIDADVVARPLGAESDYYERQEGGPRRAKNGPLDTVEEMLLIKRFDPVVLKGGPLTVRGAREPVTIPGMADLLTTFGDGKVNVNAATERVLRTLPDMDELLATAIVQEREGTTDESGRREDNSYKSVDDLFARVPGLPLTIRPSVTTDSGVYRVTGAARVHGVSKRVSFIIKYADPAIADVQGGKQSSIVLWREND